MNFALVEIEAAAKKAARGAGYSWGMAEEAAMATRWLCAHGIDGVEALLRVLEQTDGADLSLWSPVKLSGDWQARAGRMCPLIAGATLSDSAFFWAEGGKRIQSVICPVLILPFVVASARTLRKPVTVEWAGVRATCSGGDTSVDYQNADALFDVAEQVTVAAGGSVAEAIASTSRARPSASSWAKLEAFAHRTYAPETEESRIKGAGAGLTDND